MSRARIIRIEPYCIECGALARLVVGERIYPHRPDLHAKPFYLCDCGAYVGCHPDTQIALGKPAGPETRAARSHARASFDPIWKRKAEFSNISHGKARVKGYQWLAGQLGIEPTDCHMSWFDAATCRRVVEICAPYARAATQNDSHEEARACVRPNQKTLTQQGGEG